MDSAGDVGGYNSLARNAAGQPRISYVDWTNAKLKYAEMSGTGWDIDTVADIGPAGDNPWRWTAWRRPERVRR